MEMFKPRITIKLERSWLQPNAGDLTYTVEATVMVPSFCYSNAGTSLGEPTGIILRGEEAISFKVQRHDGLCAQAVQFLRFKITGIPISTGKYRLRAFVTVNDEIVAVGSQPLPRIESDDDLPHIAAVSPVSNSGVEIRSLSAWVNAMPPGPANVIAIANLFAPCGNYDFSFTDLGPFGFTGRTLRIRLNANLQDACDRVIFEGPIRFEKEIENSQSFDSIAVEFEGDLYFDPLEIVV